MYYLIYIPLYLFSLLPLQVLYVFSDAIYGLIYYIIGYRKKVVIENLLIAFPEKTEKERTKIMKDFYHNFVDTFIETIKFLSWSYDALDKRFTANLSGMEQAYASGKNINLIGMHNFNWEYANWGLVKKLKYPWLGIYMPVGNKSFDRIIRNMRSKPGTILLPATDFKNHYLKYATQLHVLGSAADQSPGNPGNAYWVNFFGRPTAFVTGVEKGARINNSAVVFGNFYKVKRGYYHIDTEYITDDPNGMPEGELTRLYVQYCEKCIRKIPANYLWSHRKWKHEYREEYGKVL
ncbi:MAG: lysophospholipid acyltransferase family protein [Chitinophagaceae bacterium]